ncbi:MAG: 16S rRNA (guanine(966)-N(2))-methyltransferase RsmD [Pseudomonadota bacterium]
MTRRRSTGTVRIIGGEFRRLQMPVAEVEGLRPTTDRVRETVFNWLDRYLPGAEVLDLFAGTGALGFEAISRGAKALVTIEKNSTAARMLRDNAAMLARERIEIIAADARVWAERPADRAFDVVFIDPPFQDADAAELCTLLLRQGWLAPDAVVYVEQSANNAAPPAAPFVSNKEKTAGQVRYGLYSVEREHHDE